MREFLLVIGSIALTAVCWGVYGPIMRNGQASMSGSHLLPFVWVGLAYCVIAVVVPAVLMRLWGEKGSWTASGFVWSFVAGVAGALGALGIILAFTFGGTPDYVMPLVFGGAPVVNTFTSMYLTKAYKDASPLFYAGLILVVVGALCVLLFKPGGPTAGHGVVKLLEVGLSIGLTVLSWGVYGPVLHKGQMKMQGSRLRPLICVGLAYFAVAVVINSIIIQALKGSEHWDLMSFQGSRGALQAARPERWSAWHHLGVHVRRQADLRDAAGVRRSAGHQYARDHRPAAGQRHGRRNQRPVFRGADHRYRRRGDRACLRTQGSAARSGAIAMSSYHGDTKTRRSRRKERRRSVYFLFSLLSVPLWLCGSLSAAEAKRPNVVLILCDNLGYGDIGCFGSQLHRTPNLDRMAAEGRKFTHFYSASGVCSPSRAALMTGCYPLRIGLHTNGEGGAVLRPMDRLGIADEEFTLAEMFRSQGYATMAVGKWHLGDQPAFLPTRHGFDDYFGIPYSEDMTADKVPGWPELPLLRGERVIEAPPDRDQLTQRYTQAAVDFISVRRDKPFFLYFPEATPGSEKTSFASAEFRDKSKNGRYGDAVEELDWSAGRILETLKKLGLDDDTLVIWTSDNGAVRRDPPQGSNAPLGGFGYSTSEGGQRMPCLMRWPARIAAGTECSELCTMMDLLPTLAKLIGAELPSDRTIDGRDIGGLVFAGAKGRSPHEAFYFYQRDQLQAVRSDRWKLHLPLKKPLKLGKAGQNRPAALYDVVADPGETIDLAAEYQDVVARLSALAEQARTDIGDQGRVGRNVRASGRVENPTPRVLEAKSQ
ncbi:MAG: sulfatase-like hydrolase/transferase [Pirellulales bacterium]